jgi:NDP-sugar pyrophosphorylase family protein
MKTFEIKDSIDRRELRAEIDNTQVVVLAGGKARRMGIDLPKCLLEVAGKRLIDWCIESLTSEGFKKFVFLLGHRYELVMEHIGDGKRYGIEARYSIDPPSNTGLGKGKALKYALLNNKIDRSRRSIVLFPDDLILEDNVYTRFLSNHIRTVRIHGVVGSLMLVPETEYPYGVAKVDKSGKIVKFIEKPLIRKPVSTGIYAFERSVYAIVEETINLEEPTPLELESTVLPLLSKEQKLGSFFIECDKWLPINTLKDYEKAARLLTIT